MGSGTPVGGLPSSGDDEFVGDVVNPAELSSDFPVCSSCRRCSLSLSAYGHNQLTSNISGRHYYKTHLPEATVL